jgi:hypothetical protein
MKRTLAALFIAGATVAPGSAAFAAASSQASCNGIGASTAAPGANDHIKAKDYGAGPGASFRAAVSQEINAEADTLGIPPGSIHQMVAHQHEGTSEGCFGGEE